MAYESQNQYETRKYIPLLEENENIWPKSNNHSAYIVVDITSEDKPEIIARDRTYTDAAHEWFRNMKEKTFMNREVCSTRELYQHIVPSKIKTLENRLRKSRFSTLEDKQFQEFKNINNDYNVEIEYK